MKLYILHGSPNTRKALTMVYHLDLDVETKQVDLASGENRQPEFLAINPNGKLPVLVDGDFKLWESNAITQYLARGSILFPDDAKAQADISRWQCWELAHWGPAVSKITWERVAKAHFGLGEPDQAAIELGLEQFHQYAPVLDAQLSGRTFITGDELTIADISVASHLMYAAPGDVPVGDYANVDSWWGRISELPAWVASAPPA